MLLLSCVLVVEFALCGILHKMKCMCLIYVLFGYLHFVLKCFSIKNYFETFLKILPWKACLCTTGFCHSVAFFFPLGFNFLRKMETEDFVFYSFSFFLFLNVLCHRTFPSMKHTYTSGCKRLQKDGSLPFGSKFLLSK